MPKQPLSSAPDNAGRAIIDNETGRVTIDGVTLPACTARAAVRPDGTTTVTATFEVEALEVAPAAPRLVEITMPEPATPEDEFEAQMDKIRAMHTRRGNPTPGA